MHAYLIGIAEEVEKKKAKLVECFSCYLLVLVRKIHKLDVLGTICKHKYENGYTGNIKGQYWE